MVQENEGTKQLKIDDMSSVSQAPMSARARIIAENPTTHRSPAHEERMKASYEAAKRAAEEAQKRLEEAQRETATEEATSEPAPISEPAPVIKPRQLQADLRQLAFTGRVEEEVVIAGFSFIMRTLTSKENNEAAGALGITGNEVQRMGELRHAILARAILAVNGMPLEGLYQGTDADKLSILRRREIVIGNWQQTLVTELMLKYNDLLERSQKAFSNATGDDLKN